MPVTTKYKDGQTIGKADRCIHCGEDLEKDIEGDACRNATDCIARMPEIEIKEGATF